DADESSGRRRDRPFRVTEADRQRRHSFTAIEDYPMFRFLATCTLIAALCVGAVLVLKFGWPGTWAAADADPTGKGKSPSHDSNKGNSGPPGDAKGDSPNYVGAQPSANVEDEKPVRIENLDGKTALQPLVFPEARILAAQRQDVPSERDGKM